MRAMNPSGAQFELDFEAVSEVAQRDAARARATAILGKQKLLVSRWWPWAQLALAKDADPVATLCALSFSRRETL